MGHINLFNTFDEYKNDNNILMPNVTYIDSTETLIMVRNMFCVVLLKLLKMI